MVSPTFKQAVIPLTLVVLFGLFAVQKRGTGGIGKILRTWLPVLVCRNCHAGVVHIASHPEILAALQSASRAGFYVPQSRY